MIKINNEKDRKYYICILENICNAIDDYDNIKNSPRGFLFLSSAFKKEESIENNKEVIEIVDSILNRR